MRISKIRIRNFANFSEFEIETGDSLVVVGENKVGKSNLIFALQLILDPGLAERDRQLGLEHFWDGLGDDKLGAVIEIAVEFTGPDTPLLTARNAELLHSIEHLAAKFLRLEPDQHDRISFDAENFKALRNRELELMAEAGADRVRGTNRSYAFPPMNSRERRLLHLALAASGLPTASSSDGPRRFVVAYPEGQQPTEPERTFTQDRGPDRTQDRTRAIRNTFRRR